MSIERLPSDAVIELRKRAFSKLYLTGEYVSPKPLEIRALRKHMGWTQIEVAKITGAAWHPVTGSTTVRKWETERDKTDYRGISYAAWRLLLIYAGVVKR